MPEVTKIVFNYWHLLQVEVGQLLATMQDCISMTIMTIRGLLLGVLDLGMTLREIRTFKSILEALRVFSTLPLKVFFATDIQSKVDFPK